MIRLHRWGRSAIFALKLANTGRLLCVPSFAWLTFASDNETPNGLWPTFVQMPPPCPLCNFIFRILNNDQRAIDDTSLSEAKSINFASRKCLTFVNQIRDKYFIRKQENTRFYRFNYSNENMRQVLVTCKINWDNNVYLVQRIFATASPFLLLSNLFHRWIFRAIDTAIRDYAISTYSIVAVDDSSPNFILLSTTYVLFARKDKTNYDRFGFSL